MSRLRYNNAVGILGGSLTAGGTTITFGAAPGFATIVAPDYIPLVLDYPTATSNANFEVVYVTAYTAGQTTGTILRGQDGTTAASHVSGAGWMVAPTTTDLTLVGASTLAFATTVTPVLPTVGDAAFTVGALTAGMILANPSGSPFDGQRLSFRFQQDGTGSRVITFGTGYGFGTDYPASLVPSAPNSLWSMTFEWVAAQSLWWCVGIARGFTGKPLPSLVQSIAAPVSSSTVTLAYSTTPAQGDGLVAFIAAQFSNTLSTTPAGWTLKWASTADATTLWCFVKTAGASESNSYVWTFSGGPSSLVALDIGGANVVDQAAAAAALSTPSGTGTTQPVMFIVAMSQNDGTNSSHMPSFTDGTLTQISEAVQFHPCVVGYKDLSSLSIPAEAGTNPEGAGSRPMGFVTLM